MNVLDLFATLKLDSSEYEKGLGDAKETAQGAGSGIGNALGKGLKVAGAAITAATTAVSAFAGASVKTGAEFDTAMSQVAATMGKTTEELQTEIGSTETSFGHFEGNLRDFAQFLGSNTAFSATQAAEALNYMALAGYDADMSMKMLPNVLSLAAAGNFDLARASDMVTDAQTAFGISADRTTQMVDEMAKAASTGNTSVEQLGDAFLVVGGLAQELNGGMVTLADGTQQPVDGLQELEIALTAMANAGVKGSEAGTHMRNMLLKLSSPTSEGAAAFEALGVSVFDTEGNMKSLETVFGELSEALSGLTQEEKIQAISDIFNVRDVAAAEALLNAVGEDWDKIGASILDAQGAAAQMAATQLDNLAGDATLFKSALEGAKIAISDFLTPSLREFVQYGTSAVAELGTAFREDGLEGALNALGPIIDRGIELIFNALPKITEAAVSLLGAFVEAIITNLPQLIPAAVQIIQQLVQSIVENLPALLDATVQIIFALADGIIEALPELIPAIVNVILTIVEKLTEPDTVVKLIEAAFKIMVAIAEGLIQAIPTLVEKVPEIIRNLLEGFVQQWPEIKKGGAELLEKFGEGIESALLGLLRIVDKVLTDITDQISGLIDSAVNWGRDLIDNFISGIEEKASALWDKVSGIAQGIRDFLGFSEPKKGPLSNFHTFAPDMMALFAQGIKDNEYLVTSQISQSFDFEPAFKKQQSGTLAGSVDSGANSDMAAIERILRQIYKEIADMPVKARMA